MKELAEQQIKNDTLEKELTELVDEMQNVHKKKEKEMKELKEKSKKWGDLQQQKDAETVNFNQIRKKDESLHAELIETNKRRKANMTLIKTVIIYCILINL